MEKYSTKLVEVRLSALTRVEYMEVVEVPADITPRQLNDLVNKRYEAVDGGEFVSDPDFWERGTCYAVDSDMPEATPSLRVVIDSDDELDVVSASATKLDCYVHVTGDATDADDEGVQGFYLIEVYLARQVALDTLTLNEKSEIAAAVLDSFHDKQGISVLDDFTIGALLPDGSDIVEAGDVPASGLILRAVHLGSVNESDLPFEQQVDSDSELPRNG